MRFVSSDDNDATTAAFNAAIYSPEVCFDDPVVRECLRRRGLPHGENGMRLGELADEVGVSRSCMTGASSTVSTRACTWVYRTL